MVLNKISAKTKKVNHKYGQNKLRIKILVFFVCAGIILPSSLALARTFYPNNIITDEELFTKGNISKTAIQVFLEREDSVLARYSQNVEGKNMTAAEMIWEVGQKYTINPKFILTTLQKEQGLIQKQQATEKELDWATGYGCYGGSCKEKYQGFYNQIEAAAETQNIYKARASEFGYRVGVTKTTNDGYPVRPENQATANFYIYTPYVGYSPELGVTAPYGGNRLFWKIWHRYFSSQKYLDGQVIKYDNNYYLIQFNKKRKFASNEIFLADHKESEVFTVSKKDFDAYPEGTPIKYPSNSLVRSSGSGQIYLLVDNLTKRPVVDNSALALLNDFSIAGVNADQIPSLAESDLIDYRLGAVITGSSVMPRGKIVRDEAGSAWLLRDGLKHAVDPVVLKNRYENWPASNMASSEISKYPTGSPVKLKDGTFVKSKGNYYIISESEKCLIANLGIFDKVFGLDRKNSALEISGELLDIHAPGYTIDYMDETIKDPAGSTPSSGSNIAVPTVPAGSYSALLESIEPLDALVVTQGQTKQISLKIKNNGSANWIKTVYLKMTDPGKAAGAFGVAEKTYPLESSVSNTQTATFNLTATVPTDKTGLVSQDFALYKPDGTKFYSVTKFFVIKPGDGTAATGSTGTNLTPSTGSAEIVSHNIPIAIRRDWGTVDITMKIKNNSDTAWLSRRTALELYNLNGSDSPFYDPNDWVRKEVVGVPLNQAYIRPGETAIFKFTLDPKGVKQGLHYLNFRIRLLDKNGIQVPLDGKPEWHRLIRVD